MLFGFIELSRCGIVDIQVGFSENEGGQFIPDLRWTVGQVLDDLLIISVAIQEMVLVIVFLTLSDDGDQYFEFFTNLRGRVVGKEHIDEWRFVGLFQYLYKFGESQWLWFYCS